MKNTYSLIWKPLLLKIVVIILIVECYEVKGGGGGGEESLWCVKKLLPCEAHLKKWAAAPATCCVPLKKMVISNTQCLCTIFNNEAILKSFNITQDDTLNLAITCGANAHHISLCSKEAAPSGSPSTPAANSSERNASRKRNAGGTILSSLLAMPAAIITCIVSLF